MVGGGSNALRSQPYGHGAAKTQSGDRAGGLCKGTVHMNGVLPCWEASCARQGVHGGGGGDVRARPAVDGRQLACSGSGSRLGSEPEPEPEPYEGSDKQKMRKDWEKSACTRRRTPSGGGGGPSWRHMGQVLLGGVRPGAPASGGGSAASVGRYLRTTIWPGYP